MSSGVTNEDEVATGCQGKSSCFSSFEVCLLKEAQLDKKTNYDLRALVVCSGLLIVLVKLMLSQGIKFKPP